MTDSITCPTCGRTSHNVNDVREGYCGNCHDWTTPPAIVSMKPDDPTAIPHAHMDEH